MRFDPPLLPGTLLERRKRFLADVRLRTGEVVIAHCPDPGRMTGLAVPGYEVLVAHTPHPRRKLDYTWRLVRTPGSWVCIDTTLANRVVGEALAGGTLSGLSAETIRPEARVAEGTRLDFLLDEGRETECALEVKSVTLERGGVAFFPDAVTERGRRHVDLLRQSAEAGRRAVLLFLVLRNDCGAFDLASDVDPAYATTLREATRCGVEVFVRRAEVTPTRVMLGPGLRWKALAREVAGG
jgi:sugar fermentation stimulation protein A